MLSFAAFVTLALATVNAQRAIVVFTSGGQGVIGNVTFTQQGEVVRLDGVIENLKPGSHGFHVHEKGDLSAGCASTGGHYNPYKKNHGGPDVKDRHVGDLGNIETDPTGITHVALEDSQISLTGPHSIVGRAVVIHSDRDDYGKGGFADSLTTGHAGTRVACGIIGTLETGLLSVNSARAAQPLALTSMLIIFATLRFAST